MALNDFTKNSKNSNKDGSNKPSGNAGFGGFGSMMSPDEDFDVEELLINYNEKFKAEPPILFRDTAIKKTIAILIGKLKPSALLIGEAGVGKTKIVEDLARRIANKDPLIPDTLRDYTIYELPLVNLVSGSSLLGDLEKKTKAVVDFASNKANHAIIFIDEIHQIVGGGANNGHYQKIAQILKPALARGDLHCIGATTGQERTNFYKDPAFNRRFSDVIVDELTQEQTAEILSNALPSFLSHYNNRFCISKDVIDKIPAIADKNSKLGSHRPDNAFTLFDRVISNEVLARTIKEANLKIQSQSGDPTAQQVALTALQALQANPTVTITEDKIRDTAVRMSKSEAQPDHIDFDALKQKLARIEGQDDVIDELLVLLKRTERALFPRKKPISLLFAGTSGVGKTEITKIIAEYTTGVEPITLNMTEYSHAGAVNSIIGVDAGFVGSDDKNELPLDKLESNPYQIVLLDEFEKAHKAVQRLFMGVFDEGILKTKRGSVIDCSKAIFVATTNAGNKEVHRSLGFGNTDNNDSNTDIDVTEMKKWFDAELLNRFTKRYRFHSLSEDIYISILEHTYDRELQRIRADFPPAIASKLKDVIDPDDIEKFREEYQPDFGARPIFNIVEEYIESQLD